MEANDEMKRLVKIQRILPGSPYDIIVRAISLNVMWCCYRNSRKARFVTAWIWLLAGVGLFIGTLAYLLYYVPHDTQTYTDEINAAIETAEADGEDSLAEDLI